MKINKQFTYPPLVQRTQVRGVNFTLNSNLKLGAGDYDSQLVNRCCRTERSAVNYIQKKSYIYKKKDYLTQGPKGSVQRIVTRNTKISTGCISKSYTYIKSFYYNTYKKILNKFFNIIYKL